MDGFLDKEGRKVSASHDTSNYYPPSSESASLSHTAFGAQVGGGSMHEGHCHYGPGHQGAMGSFSQLLMHADAGILWHGHPASLWNHTDLKASTDDELKCLHDSTEDDMCEVGDCEEGYQAGTESEQENGEAVVSNGEVAFNPINETYNSISDFVTTFSDTIGREDFLRGRGFDDDDFVRGIDDTELNGFELSNGENSDIQFQDEVPDEASKYGDDIENIPANVNLEDELPEEDGHHELNKASAAEGRCCNDNTESETDGYACPSTLGDCGCAKQEIAQEISERYLAQAGVAYKKRYRTNKNMKGTDCRKPRDMGAVEIAVRTASHRKGEHIFEPILGMVFDSKEEGYEFYNMYSWEYGFGIIYNKNRPSSSKDPESRTMQEFCCDKVGKDRRVSSTTKKVNCKARIKLLRDENRGWYISEFVKDHNHPLAESCSEKRNLFSHKRLDPYTLGVIRYLREVNVDQTKVRCIIGSMFESFKDAPCTKRSIRTICSQIAREQMDDDVGKTMELFKKMKEEDPGFQWSVEVGEGSRINTLMWCSGKSREQYACFGDVVTFDTTYSTNFYKMPFGLFVGVNTHFRTIVYGGVLIRNETIESFKWVFKEFENLMGAKPPRTVLTDQCKAMSIALGEVWPDTFHLWCKWHVLKKIRECLGPTYTKNAAFRDEFYSIVNEMMTKQEFVDAWSDLCERYQLTENPFMIRTFQCRSKWAKPWSKGNFCAGMTSTQRSESANWMLKRFVPRNSSMNQFVSQFNKLLDDRDMEEGREENLTKQLVVKYSRLWPIERHAIKIYTRQSLKLFHKQVDLAANFRVTGKGPDFYLVARNNEDQCPEWRKIVYKVFVYDEGGRYFCECGFFEHIGILCCHTLRLMIMLSKSRIPDSHIVTRWTRNAKDVLPDHMKLSSNKSNISDTECIWRRRVNAKALEAVTKGNTDRRTQDILMRHLDAAMKEVDEDLEARKNQAEIECSNDEELSEATDVEAAKGNRYGAAGSSAGMSDSDILNLKAPVRDKSRGRPVIKRLKSSAEKNIKKAKKLGVGGQTVSTKKSVAASKSNTRKKKVKGKTQGAFESPASPINRGVPYQSKFCSKCGKPGHNKRNCGNTGEDGSVAVRNVSRSGKEGNNRCTKCDLKGHNEQECLVLDEDSGNYFK